MILIGLGANLPGPAGAPLASLKAALAALADAGVATMARSRWYESAPVPVSDQPWFINAVAMVDTSLGATELLSLLHRIEAEFGRQRRVVDSARTLDLDLLDYHGTVRTHGPAPLLPHPRLQDRAFVLHPLHDIAPDWRHPVLGLSPAAMIARLPSGQVIRPLAA